VLPSFRLIVATFLCSFLIAFFGLRMAVTPRFSTDTAGRPAAPLPLQLTGADAGADMRRVDGNAPVVFDLRFAMGATAPTSVPSGLTLHAIDRAKRESGFDVPVQAEATEPAVSARNEPRIEVAALPEPSAATADAPPPTPGPPAAIAAIETMPDVENVGTTQAAPEHVVKKRIVAVKAKPKKKVVRRARTKQAAQSDLSSPVFNPFPNNP
jgi:hypothetical protein